MRWLTWTQCRSAEFRCVSTQVLRLRGVAPPSVSVSQNVSQILRFRWVIIIFWIKVAEKWEANNKTILGQTDFLHRPHLALEAFPPKDTPKIGIPKTLWSSIHYNTCRGYWYGNAAMLKIPQPTGPNPWGARLAWLLPGGFRWVPLLPSKPSGSLGHLAMLGGHDWKNNVFFG